MIGKFLFRFFLHDAMCIFRNFFHALCSAAIKRGMNFNKKFKKEVCSSELEANIKKVLMESSGPVYFFMYVDNQEHTHG